MKENYEIYSLFDEFDTNTIGVSDFGIKYKGILIDYIHIDNDGNISIWAGNPDTDKDAEELFPNEYQRKKIFDEILDYLG